MQTPQTLCFKRYYANDGVQANPELNTDALHRQIHALLTHWVAAGNFRRDFVQALDHLSGAGYSIHSRPVS